jgi:tetratricopeptide (TPR) repeat protein
MEHNDQQDDQQQEIISAHQTDAFLLANYHQIAQELNDSLDVAAADRALAPIINAPDTTQIALLKALAQENTSDAADIAQAIQTLTTNKEIRKEARRTLVRLETQNIYPGWEPPEAPTLSQALEQITNPDSDTGDPILTELQSLFAGAEDLFAEDESVETVHDFITEWSDGNYEEAYDHLASTSPLRAGLSREDWVARHQEWFNAAHPAKLEVTFADPTDEDETESPTIEAGWSIEFADLSQESALPALLDMPFATATFAETGRHWFWTNYTVIQEDDRWVIQDMIDTGAEAFKLSEDELRERINDLKEQVALVMEGEDDEDEDDDEDDEDDDFEDLEDEDEDDDLDEDDDEDVEDASLLSSLDSLGDVLSLTVKAMHYSDALIAKVQGEDASVYELAVEQALSANEAERAAVYAQKFAENIPDARPQALNTLALIYSVIAASSHEDDEHDEEERFVNLAKTTLRNAITGGTNPKGEILLANMLIQDDENQDEAETLLLHAKESVADNDSFFSIDMGLAEIAMSRDNKEAALNYYLHASSLNPEDEEIWFRVGYLQSQLDRYPDAVLSLQRSIALAPELTEAYTELAGIYVAQKSLGKARETLREGLDVNPDAADLLAALALVYLQGNDTRSAAKYLEQAEALDPEDEMVQQTRQMFNAQRTQQRSQQRYKQNKPNNKKRR